MTSTKVDQMIHFAKSDEHEKYIPVINFQISAIFGILKFIIRTKFVFYWSEQENTIKRKNSV